MVLTPDETARVLRGALGYYNPKAATALLRSKLGFRGDHYRPGTGADCVWGYKITRADLDELTRRYGS